MAKLWFSAIFMILLAVSPVTPATAQSADLSIAAGEPWTHKHSGIRVPATLGGIDRSKAVSFVEDELDVGLVFDTPAVDEALTFYVFRDSNGGVPVWFAQAQWAIENRDTFGQPTLAVPPQAVALPGRRAASGLKAVYQPHGSAGYRSTGVALIPVNGWYVKIRASSKSRSPAEMAAWMDRTIAEIGWPVTIDEAPVAVPVTACTPLLSFAAAAQDAPAATGTGAAEAIGAMLRDKLPMLRAKRPASWCSDAELGGNLRIYRPDGDSERYLIAMGDNGNGIVVGRPEAWGFVPPSAKAGGVPAYFMTANDLRIYAPQDRLPSPQRVAELINNDRVVARIKGWGDKTKIEIMTDPN